MLYNAGSYIINDHFHYFCKLNDKTIKKSYKILFYLLLGLIILPSLIYLVVLIPGVQKSVGKAITSRLSEDLGVDITIKNVRFYPIKKLVINDLLIKDTHQDTLLFINELESTIDSILFSSRHIYLGKITANKLKTNIIKNKGQNNFQFLIDSLSRQHSKPSQWKYAVNEFRIKNSIVVYKNLDASNTSSAFNSNNIQLNNLNTTIDHLKLFEDSLAIRVQHFSCDEQSGLSLMNTHGEIGVGQKGIELKNININANNSSLNLEYLRLKYDSTQQLNNFIHDIPFELKIKTLTTDYRDLHYFFPQFPQLNEKIKLGGSFSGTIDDLKGRNIYIHAGTNTELNTDFDIKGLPQLTETFIYLNVKRLNTNIYDLAKITTLNKETRDFKFPANFERFGDIEYSGKFTGFIDNLVAYGLFKTDIGNIKTDLGIKLTEDKRMIYSGFINTTSLNIGKLLNTDNDLNNITMHVAIRGYRVNNKYFNAYIKGSIDSIDYKNYKYEKIMLNGLLANKRFDGKVTLNDPNAQVQFNGKLDFEKEIPEFDFTALLKNIKLDKLNIAPKLENSSLSVNLSSKLSGKSFNSIDGHIILENGELKTSNKSFSLDTFLIAATQNNEIKTIKISSDLIEGELVGNYNLQSLPNEIYNQLNIYLPSIFNTSKKYNTQPCNLTFNIHTKKLASLINIINPDIILSDNSSISGNMDSQNNILSLSGELDELKYKAFHGQDVSLQLNTHNHSLNAEVRSENVIIGGILPLYNFTLSQQARNDSMKLNLFWNNWDEITNSGAIYTETKFNKGLDDRLFTNINLLPSSIIMNDSTWLIQNSQISVNREGVNVKAFRISHLNQEINVNGSVYNDNNNNLSAYFQNINLKETSNFINLSSLSIDGLLNGNINFEQSTKNPVITSNILINDLRINDETIGNLALESTWNQEKKAIELSASSKRDSINTILGSGYFIPQSKDYSFDMVLDSLPVGFLNLYLSNIAQNFKGSASGRANIRNRNDKLYLDADLYVNKTKFDVDLLKSSYFLEDSIRLTSDSLIFKNMTLTDMHGKMGAFSGNILHDNFADMSYDLYVMANNMQLLHTKEQDNPLYYGMVNGTGDLSVTGISNDLLIDINVKTEANTKFYIPISDKQESLDYNFIQFLNPSDTIFKENKDTHNAEYKINLPSFKLNMGLEITPDAQVQVIFDPTVGDILKTTGHGNLQIQISKEGDVSFYGNYTAEDGDYLFTLEKVVNKKFDINRGGTVVWEGNPYDAQIDLTATYKLKTSIQPLVGELSDESSESTDVYRRIPIYCDLILSGNLSQPTIEFDISAPTMEESTQNLIEDAISSEEELNRQVLSLLILNKFYTTEYSSSSSSTSSNQMNNAALTTTSEMLSRTLSNWLSKMSNDLDVDLSYIPEDEITSEQIDVALSTQIFNNRVTLNGNVEYGGYSSTSTSSNTNNIVGDFDLAVKLNRSGSLRAKVYTHSNDDYSYTDSPTTQGVGISYQEEFDTVGELIRKYWNWITGKGKREKEISIENDKRTVNNRQ